MSEQQETFEGWVILEEWRAIPGYEGVYEVSNLGQVRRVGRAARHGSGRGGGARIGRILRQHTNGGRYAAVQLWRDGQPRMHLVHRLVATAFIGPIPEGVEVNHRNGDKSNNTVANLEFMTHRANNQHAYDTGLHPVRVEQMTRVRRKPRTTVQCACGCGTPLETPDRKGRDRSFVSGHNMRRPA